ncbi:putative leucine-rich repeat-containing protein DDB_G0290503 [Prorops nasuta]|uniref:putative leucine-rich repeat-containing protein DDB_G0290503 n=1 Tax=Prorops nasuta TaxID=863751 RepID=UPI0034CEBA75
MKKKMSSPKTPNGNREGTRVILREITASLHNSSPISAHRRKSGNGESSPSKEPGHEVKVCFAREFVDVESLAAPVPESISSASSAPSLSSPPLSTKNFKEICTDSAIHSPNDTFNCSYVSNDIVGVEDLIQACADIKLNAESECNASLTLANLQDLSHDQTFLSAADESYENPNKCVPATVSDDSEDDVTKPAEKQPNLNVTRELPKSHQVAPDKDSPLISNTQVFEETPATQVKDRSLVPYVSVQENLFGRSIGFLVKDSNDLTNYQSSNYFQLITETSIESTEAHLKKNNTSLNNHTPAVNISNKETEGVEECEASIVSPNTYLQAEFLSRVSEAPLSSLPTHLIPVSLAQDYSNNQETNFKPDKTLHIKRNITQESSSPIDAPEEIRSLTQKLLSSSIAKLEADITREELSLAYPDQIVLSETRVIQGIANGEEETVTDQTDIVIANPGLSPEKQSSCDLPVNQTVIIDSLTHLNRTNDTAQNIKELDNSSTINHQLNTEGNKLLNETVTISLQTETTYDKLSETVTLHDSSNRERKLFNKTEEIDPKEKVGQTIDECTENSSDNYFSIDETERYGLTENVSEKPLPIGNLEDTLTLEDAAINLDTVNDFEQFNDFKPQRQSTGLATDQCNIEQLKLAAQEVAKDIINTSLNEADESDQFAGTGCEIFEDPTSFDFLLEKGKTINRIRDLRAESLYIKFDPLISNTNMLPQSNNQAINEDHSEKNEATLPSVGTPTRSPALAAIDRLLFFSPISSTVQNSQDKEAKSPVQQSKIDSESEVYKNIAKELELVRATVLELEDQIEKQNKEHEAELERQKVSFQEKITKLQAQLAQEIKSKEQMTVVVDEYEKSISRLVAERERDRTASEQEKTKLQEELQTANHHLNNTEAAFNDVHQKYERLKGVVSAYKSNETVLKESIQENVETIKTLENRYDQLKNHAMAQLDKANSELDAIRKQHEAEAVKLHAMVRKAELKSNSLAELVEQKTKENKELSQIIDEVIARVGRQNAE